jgi:phosphatidylserine/phosphatidylglycerophosphate/cardiolipin synthase-like enzyme
MTRKRSNPTRKTTNKKTGSRSSGGLIVVLIILLALFLVERIGWIHIDWQGLLEGEDIETVISIPGEDGPNQPVLVVEPVSGEWYKLYFTSPQYPDTPETRVGLVEQGLVETINQAQQTLDIAIYELNLESVAGAILAARDRGVAVRLVTDSDTLAEEDALIRLQKERIPIVADERSSIMHNKFVIIDGRAVWTGSWNFTRNDTFRNNNNAIYIESPELARNYTAEFEEMFSQKAFGPTSPANTTFARLQIGDTLLETCFSPEDKCDELLTARINEAQQSIRFMAFSFTHSGIGQAVRDRARAGVTVQGVFETRGSETVYSEFGQKKQENLDVWQDGNPYTMHHKVFIIDEQIVVTGSFNFSNNAARSNDENMLIIHDATIARQYLEEFNRVYSQAANRSGS